MVKKLLITAMMVATIPIVAEVTVELSKDEISEIGRVTLTIRLDGIPPRDEPDFSALDDFFEIEMNRIRDQRIINNQYISSVTWILTLRPKRVGEFKIPSFEIGSFTTEELTLNVVPISDEIKEKLDQEVFWITKVDRQEQYVHGGIHVERKLYYSNNVTLVRMGRRGGIPAPDDVDDAHIVNLGNQNDDWAPLNGRTYRVYTQEFVIFAEKSGTLSLPQTSVTANIDIDDGSVTAAVHTESHELTILPRPEEYPAGSPWLPASNVVISDDLGELNLSNLVVGDSFSRQITIEALDSFSTGIPGIEMELPDGMRSYPTNPDFRNEILGNKIIGSRTDEHAFVVTRAGEYRIPDTELVWWNTDTKEVERSIIPGRTFIVGAGSAANAAGNNVAGNTRPQVQGVSALDGANVIVYKTPLYMLVLMITGIVLMVTSIGLLGGFAFIQGRRRNRATTKSVEDINLETLLKSKSSRDVKEGMLRWLTIKLHISRVNAILLLQKHPTTAVALRRVNDQQYSTSSEAAQLDRNEIKRALKEIEQEVQRQRSHTTTFWQFYQPT